jgi:TRAP-type C4-dicarboxylate transport system permease small subunit
MSEPARTSYFPQRTPKFTTVVVLVCFALFAWLAWRIYVPHAAEVAAVEGVRTPDDRKKILADLRAKEQAAAHSYGWVDQSAGVVRLPLDRAIELTVQESARR